MQIKSSSWNYGVFATSRDSYLISLYCTVGSTPSLKYVWLRFLKGSVAACSHSSSASCKCPGHVRVCVFISSESANVCYTDLPICTVHRIWLYCHIETKPLLFNSFKISILNNFCLFAFVWFFWAPWGLQFDSTLSLQDWQGWRNALSQVCYVNPYVCAWVQLCIC